MGVSRHSAMFAAFFVIAVSMSLPGGGMAAAAGPGHSSYLRAVQQPMVRTFFLFRARTDGLPKVVTRASHRRGAQVPPRSQPPSTHCLLLFVFLQGVPQQQEEVRHPQLLGPFIRFRR